MRVLLQDTGTQSGYQGKLQAIKVICRLGRELSTFILLQDLLQVLQNQAVHKINKAREERGARDAR